jgi:mercuric ion transport protein
MDNRTLLKAGIAGSVLAALCCATPILVILLGALGLSAWAGWLDYVLMPALVVFAGITIYALRRRQVEATCCASGVGSNTSTRGKR